MSTKKIQTVLIVEDDKPLRAALREKIELGNFTVVEANNGVEGFTIAAKERPDFILMDILMPKMHGFDSLRKIRAEDWGKKIPVILLSNISNEPTAIEIAKNDKYCGYLVKSDVTIESVIDRIKAKLTV